MRRTCLEVSRQLFREKFCRFSLTLYTFEGKNGQAARNCHHRKELETEENTRREQSKEHPNIRFGDTLYDDCRQCLFLHTS